MAKCWLCGNQVKPDTRYLNCEKCQGHIVTPDPAKYPNQKPQIKMSFRELERMMQSANTYERRHGRLKQKRRAAD